MTYYDQTFEPWKSVDGKCVVADETEWKRINRINRSAYSDYLDWVEIGGERPPRPIVKVTDIFEDVTLCPVDSRGTPIGIADWLGDNGFGRAINHGDLITRFFRAIDSTPYVDYLIVTQHAELVKERWPIRTGEHPCIKGIDCDRHDDFSRSNVILATYVETQNDIERLVPQLLKCHDLCKGLAVVCNPREELRFDKMHENDESIDIVDLLRGHIIDCAGGVHPMCCSVNLIIAEGNEHPMHPDHVRSLRDQCDDASVKFNFAGWGEWAPRTTHKESLTGQDQHTAFIDGMPGDKFPEDYRMVRWGHERSGRLLDGVEHNGRLA